MSFLLESKFSRKGQDLRVDSERFVSNRRESVENRIAESVSCIAKRIAIRIFGTKEIFHVISGFGTIGS